MSPTFCSDCGSGVAPEDKFCGSCGAPAPGAPAATDAPDRVHADAATQVQAGAAAALPVVEEPRTIRVPKRLVTFGAGIVAFVLVVGIAATVVADDSDEIERVASAGAVRVAESASAIQGVDSESFSLPDGLPEGTDPTAVDVEAIDPQITSRDKAAGNVIVKLTLRGKLDYTGAWPGERPQVIEDRPTFSQAVRAVVYDDGQRWQLVALESMGQPKIETALPAQPDVAQAKTAGALAAKAAEALLTVGDAKAGIATDKDAAAYRKRQEPFYAVLDSADPDEDSEELPVVPTMEEAEGDWSAGWRGPAAWVAADNLPDSSCQLPYRVQLLPSTATASAKAVPAAAGDQLFQHVVASGRIAVTAKNVECSNWFEDATTSDERLSLRFRAELIRSRVNEESKWYIGRLTFATTTSTNDAYSAQRWYRSEGEPENWFTTEEQ